MIFVIVKNEDLTIQHSYEAEESRDSDRFFGYQVCSPFCSHIPLPEGLVVEKIKAERNDAGEITLSEDAALVVVENPAWWKIW